MLSHPHNTCTSWTLDAAQWGRASEEAQGCDTDRATESRAMGQCSEGRQLHLASAGKLLLTQSQDTNLYLKRQV